MTPCVRINTLGDPAGGLQVSTVRNMNETGERTESNGQRRPQAVDDSAMATANADRSGLEGSPDDPTKSLSLDFLIIGAQKAGTTALFENMRLHPQLVMPAAKELPFFDDETVNRVSLETFLSEHFAAARGDERRGKATPGYMSSPGAAARIAALLPDVRLIAIVRDPIERAYSQYRMNERRSIPQDPFDDVIARQLTALENDSTVGDDSTTSHVGRGEYGRALAEYFEVFPRTQLLVVSSDELERDPSAVFTSIWAHLDVSPFEPPRAGERIHAGGSRQRLAVARRASRSRIGKRLLRLVPDRSRQLFRFRFNQWNVVPEVASTIPLEPATMQRLRCHYRSDADRLHSLGVSTPWIDRWGNL
jgi:Sulfotransferase domain